MDAVETRVNKVVRAAFNLGPSKSLEGVAYKAHPRWDSLGHIQFILALEKEFGVKLSSRDMLSARSPGDAARTVRACLGRAKKR